MEERSKILIIFVILLFLSTIGYVVKSIVYPIWGRTLVYSANNTLTRYPGEGKITQFTDRQIFVNPKMVGKPFFDTVENIATYPESDYEIIGVPAQDRFLFFVGKFERWEDIDGSLDKYIILRYPNSREAEKFRVAFEQSDLFKDQLTIQLVEKVGFRFKKDALNNIVNMEKGNLVDLGYETAAGFFKKNDAVVIQPVIDPPELAKTDSDGYYLAEKIIIRRVK